MTDFNPEVVRIQKIEKHPNADSLSIATVLGDYPVIIKTGDFNIGDLVAYLPIDAIVPDTEQFYFLCPKGYEKYVENGVEKQRQVGSKFFLGSVPEKYRILKAKKLRGIYSMGLLIPAPANMQEGESVVDFFNLKKWEEPEQEENVVQNKMKAGEAEKKPEGWSVPYYDIHGIRKYLEAVRSDEEIIITEKLNGSNAMFTHDGKRLWVRSRNFYKRRTPDMNSWLAAIIKFDLNEKLRNLPILNLVGKIYGLIRNYFLSFRLVKRWIYNYSQFRSGSYQDPWNEIAIRYNLEKKLAKYPMLAFFGELYGLVGKFPYDTEIVDGKRQSKVRFFDIWDIKNKRYLDYDQRVSILQELGLDSVPELYRGFWTNKEEMYKFAEGKSTLNSSHLREGVVVITTQERYEPLLDARFQLKIIGEGYTLQK